MCYYLMHFLCVVWMFGSQACVNVVQGKIATESFSRELKDKHGLFSDEQKPEDSYAEAFKETFALAVGVVGQLTGLGRSIDETKEPSLEGNITSWRDILHSYVMNLQMDHVCDAGENLSVLVVCSFALCLSSYCMFLLL